MLCIHTRATRCAECSDVKHTCVISIVVDTDSDKSCAYPETLCLAPWMVCRINPQAFCTRREVDKETVKVNHTYQAMGENSSTTEDTSAVHIATI